MREEWVGRVGIGEEEGRKEGRRKDFGMRYIRILWEVGNAR